MVYTAYRPKDIWNRQYISIHFIYGYVVMEYLHMLDQSCKWPDLFMWRKKKKNKNKEKNEGLEKII